MQEIALVPVEIVPVFAEGEDYEVMPSLGQWIRACQEVIERHGVELHEVAARIMAVDYSEELYELSRN